MTVQIIRDALPLELAEECRALFLEAQFGRMPNEDGDFFGKTFPEGGFGIPSPDEVYITDFETGNIPRVRDIVGSHVVPAARAAMRCPVNGARLYFYKFPVGGHLRLHTDKYAGHSGFVWHLSKNWAWDWGGLMIDVDGEIGNATLPVFNSLVLIEHSKAVPHLVTQVAPWAKEPRMIVSGIIH